MNTRSPIYPLLCAILSVLALILSSPSPAHAQAPTEWPQISLTPIATGLTQPLFLTHAGDGSGRLFIIEQRGRIRLYKDGALQSASFLDLSSRVSCCGERGLLGLAFPPDYAHKGYFYVSYTDRSGGSVLSRIQMSADPDRADPNSEEIILSQPQPYANHNGGMIAFGPQDGYLYIGLGDGGSAGDPQNNGQAGYTWLGKLLRLDTEAGIKPYQLPPTNPFTKTNNIRPEIWALGLRNPWRFSFDRETGDLWIGDVGQGAWEEIDFQPASSAGGENYGWRIMEGTHCYKPATCSSAGRTLPVAEYSHSEGCSVTGGYVYQGSAYPRLRGIYLFADYCSGKLWGLRREDEAWSQRVLFEAGSSQGISSFGEDTAGNLYVIGLSSGTIYALRDSVTPIATATATSTPQPTTTPSSIATATRTQTPTLPLSTSTATATASPLPNGIRLPLIMKER